jgi:cell shape-determining protein MreC
MVNNDPIILAMFNAIKELKAENEQLRQQLQTENQGLKKKLEQLEQTVTQLAQPQSRSQNL